MKRRLTLDRILPRSPEARRMVLAGAGLFFGSAIITLIILLATGGLAGARRPASVETGAEEPLPPSPTVGLSDLLLPPSAGWGAAAGGPIADLEAAQAAGEAPPYLLRAPLDRWSEEQIGRYWVPLDDIAVDQIKAENDRRIRALFEEVP